MTETNLRELFIRVRIANATHRAIIRLRAKTELSYNDKFRNPATPIRIHLAIE